MTEGMLKILPPLNNSEIIPDLEHTVLLPFSLLTFYGSLKNLLIKKRERKSTTPQKTVKKDA
jgi:hypothetical protein